MKVRIFISDGTSIIVKCRDGADVDCLALPRESCRFEFWNKETGLTLKGHALVWEVVER